MAVLGGEVFEARRAVPSTVASRRRPDQYTRLGGAVRHVPRAWTERETRRLLFILSDGKPNDVDAYEGTYGVEDTRQAVAEASRQG